MNAALPAVWLALLMAADGSTSFHVAPDGSDSNPGTPEQPFASLEAARDAVRRLKQAGPLAGAVTVWIRGGTYSRDKTFVLSAEDGGTPRAPVTYRAFPGETARLAGGREIPASSWKLVQDGSILARLPEAARGRVLAADLKAHGISDFGEMSILAPMLELFLEGRRLPLARWPNEGWAPIGDVVKHAEDGAAQLVAEDPQGQTFRYEGDRPARWRSAPDAVLHGFWYYGWMDQHVAVRGIDTEKREITLAETPGGGIKKGQWFRALNLLEEIDEPGEWYLDRNSGVAYLWPPPECAGKTVLVSLLKEALVALEGPSYVTVRGLILEGTRGIGAVIGGGEENRLAGCILRGIGSQGAIIDGGARNGLEGCDIHDAGAGGVRITGGNRSTLVGAGNYVLNCHIHRYAQRKKVYEPAVRLYGVGHRVAHNLIHDAPHQAIAYDGNDHTIEYNEIHDVVLESSDAGVLYTGRDWTFRGNIVRHNFFHDIPHRPGFGAKVVYLDDCASSTDIIGNVFCKARECAFIGGGRDNTVENNIFIDCEKPVHLDTRGLTWDHFRPDGPMYESLRSVPFDRPPWSTRYPALARILQEHPQAPRGNILARNVSVRSSWGTPDAKYFAVQDNLVTAEDPGFVEAARGNFALREDSVVFQKVSGFRRIPFEKIGLYADEYRAVEPATAFHVSPQGDDAGPGTSEKPFRTLEAARDAARGAAREGKAGGPITVWIRGGTYLREKTFRLAKEDAGSRLAPRVYRAVPGEVPRLVGGREIPPAALEPVKDPAVLARLREGARGSVLQVSLGGLGITDLGEPGGHGGGLEAFAGGRRLPLARWPNEGWALARRAGEAPGRKITFSFEGDPPSRWARPGDIRLRGYFHQEYQFDAWRCEGMDPEKREIALPHDVPRSLDEPRRFHAANVLEEIDAPGEWFLDRASGVLYLLPSEDFGRVPIFVSLLDQPFLALDGASFITIEGLSLEVARGAAVVVSGGTRNRIAGCKIRGAGTAAILSGGTDNEICGCDIEDIAGTGVRLTGGDRRTLEPANLRAVNNHIHRYAQLLKTWQPGIRIEGVGNRAAHNWIHDAPQYAISYDGNDHVIELNDFHDVCLEMSDVGVVGCGTDWTIRNNAVRFNYIHDIPERPYPGTAGVYLDNCASSTAILGNIFRRVRQAAFIGGGRDNLVENNIFIECEKPVHLDNRGLRWDHFKPGGPMYETLRRVPYDKPPWSTRYPELARILDEIPQAPLGNVLARNLSVRSTWRDPEAECRAVFKDHIDKPYMRIEENLVTEDDPGFAGMARGDYRLREDAEVFKKIPAFRRPPFERMGIRVDEFRPAAPMFPGRP